MKRILHIEERMRDRILIIGGKASWGERRGGNGQRQEMAHEVGKRLETRVFDLYRERYGNLTELARTMGISVSQIYRVKQRKRHINEKFITGTVRAFPGYKLDDLFCIVPDGRRYDKRQ